MTKRGMAGVCPRLHGFTNSKANRQHFKCLSIAAAISLLYTSLSAQAQSQAQPDSQPVKPVPASSATAPADAATAAEPTEINGVVVTATRRQEPALEVPMQVNTLSGDALQAAGARKLNDYANLQPGVTFQSAGGTGQGQLSIRGVTNGTETSPTVGVYVDDVAFGSSTYYGGSATLALDLGLLDTDHIEIMRGPQGTLFGAGSMGGLLKYVSVGPDLDTWFGDVGAGPSFTQRGGIDNTAHAVVNAPILPGLAALRISGFNNHDAGYVDAVGTKAADGVEHGDTSGARASLLLAPASGLTMRFNAIVQDINRNGQDLVDYDMAGHPVDGDLKRNIAAGEPFHQTVQLYSADMEYQLGWSRFNWISSYQSMRSDFTTDLSAEYVPIFAGSGLQFDSVTSPNAVYTSKWSQELRLTSRASHTFEWLAGLYFTHEGSDLRQALNGEEDGTNSALENVGIPTTYQEYAAYGDLTYSPVSRLSFTGGVRVAHNHQAYEQDLSGMLVGAPTVTASTSSDTSTTYLGTAKYEITQSSNVYFRTATGYRPGGPNDEPVDPVTHQPLAGRAVFDPDKLYSYEVGYKGDFLQHRLSLQTALFDIYWKHIQQLGSVDGVNQVINAGDARNKGVELAAGWHISQSWQLNAATAWTQARLKTGDSASGTKSGDDLPNTPHFSASFSANYLQQLFDHPFYAGVTERYIGRRNSSFDGETATPNFVLPAYAVTDLQSGLDFSRVKLSLFLRNAFDRRGLLTAQTAYVPLGGPAQATVLQPRTIGLEANVPF